MPIHRHHESSETVVIIRGCIRWIFHDENGNETERVTLDANGELRMLNVEKNRWHSLECLESGSVLYESKDGPYHPLEVDEIMVKLKNGKYEEQKDHRFGKRSLGFLLLFVLAAEKAKRILMDHDS